MAIIGQQRRHLSTRLNVTRAVFIFFLAFSFSNETLNRYEGRIAIPENLLIESIESTLSDDGFLTITAKQAPVRYEKIIPVFPADPHAHMSDHPRVSPGGP